jgi:hypothetical protein
MKSTDHSIYGLKSPTSNFDDVHNNIGIADIRHCRAMIVCLTPKYFHNQDCLNELRMCEIYAKPIFVCLLKQMNRFCSNQLHASLNLDQQIERFIPPTLPMTTAHFLRKNIRTSCINLTTDELFARNATMLIQRLESLQVVT